MGPPVACCAGRALPTLEARQPDETFIQIIAIAGISEGMEKLQEIPTGNG